MSGCKTLRSEDDLKEHSEYAHDLREYGRVLPMLG